MSKETDGSSIRISYEESLEWAKFPARIILTDGHPHKIIIPSREEMIGIYTLERDDQLPPRKETSQ